VSSLTEFEDAFTRSLTEPGVTIVDVRVDYSRNTELLAELHHGVLE
jgi:acetolactate synthase I/II/III large subunit